MEITNNDLIIKISETDIKQCAEWLYNQHACDSKATFRAYEDLVKTYKTNLTS